MDNKMNFNRRGFLKSSALGAAGAIISSSALGNPLAKQRQNLPVITRKLGKTGLELPIVSFGVMRSDNANLIRSALEMGYVHFDSAYSYMGGRNEQMLGEVFKEYPRDSFVISTKVQADGIDRRTGALGPGSTKEAFLAKFEESLGRLQMDYVDIFYFHQPPNREVVLAPQYLEALNEIKKQGKARFVGLSTHSNEPEVIQAAIDSNVYDIVLVGYNFKHQRAGEIKEKIALAAQKGLGIIGMKPMAGAFMDQERQHPINCKAALKWVLQDPNVHTTIPGITTFEMLTENFSVMENLELTEEEKNHLEEAKLVAGLYCGGCDDCTHQCKKHLPVHEIMRAFMYAYGYRDYDHAYAVLEEYNLSSSPCADCNECVVKCPKGILVADRIASVSKLRELPRNMLV
ncbi:MAG: aldo/keto reductase [Bacteroidales bacterium]|nr:aldo/keto reductase [Bacteroidales bacterium]